METRSARQVAYVLLGSILVAGTAPAFADSDKFLIEFDGVSIQPADKPRVGEPVIVKCRWRAEFLKVPASKPKTVFEIGPTPPTQLYGALKIKYQTDAAAGTSQQGQQKAKPGYYTAEQPLKGEFTYQWIPEQTGAALATCTAWGPYDHYAQHSQGVHSLRIQPPKHEMTGAADSSASTVFVAPPAKLSIENSGAKPTGNCVAVLPRAVASIRLAIRNSGKALPAGRGVATARCCSGLVVSPQVKLPAIGPGQTASVDIPVGFAQATRGAENVLSGKKRTFIIQVKPNNPDAFAAPAPFTFDVEFTQQACTSHRAGRED